MKYLFIVNDGPYGTEKAYNACRLAMTMQNEVDADIRIFLMADAVANAVAGQNTPQGFYNVERMLRGILAKGGRVRL